MDDRKAKPDKALEHREPAPPSRWYAVSSGFLATFIMMFAGFLYLKHLQDATVDAKRVADREAVVQREKALNDTCTVLEKLRKTYTDLSNPSAKQIADVWAQLEIVIHCPGK
jgi:hypothetical protein